MLSAKILFCVCFTQYIEITLSNDVLIDDLPQIVKQIRQEIDLLKDENAKLKERNEIMEEKNAIMEDDIQERVDRLEQLAKIGTLRSCAEYARYGLNDDGDFLIDPDGPLMGSEPFQVFCNFTAGTTEIYHDTEGTTEVDHCHDPGCYVKPITYIDGNMTKNEKKEVPLSQIVSLIQISESCQQSFTFDCTMAPFTKEDIDFSFWEDRNGGINNYYTGSNFNNHVCDCFYDEEGCAEEEVYSNSCNCDANLPLLLQDTGTITNTSALPITKMYFGGLTYEIQYGAFTLGRLKCFGEKTFESGKSCSDLKRAGVYISGHYAIKPANSNQQKLVYCDMQSDTYDDVNETEELVWSPIGTILPWVPKLDSSGEILPLPHGWVFCNGSSITEGPWSGLLSPNLTGMFLRGGDINNVLEQEQSQLQDHSHKDSGHSHGCAATSNADDHTHTYQVGENVPQGDRDCDNNPGCWVTDDHSVGRTETLVTGSSSLSISTSCEVASEKSNLEGVDTNNANAGTETRPANVKVIYIIRVV